jgi:hypothetical protein
MHETKRECALSPSKRCFDFRKPDPHSRWRGSRWREEQASAPQLPLSPCRQMQLPLPGFLRPGRRPMTVTVPPKNQYNPFTLWRSSAGLGRDCWLGGLVGCGRGERSQSLIWCCCHGGTTRRIKLDLTTTKTRQKRASHTPKYTRGRRPHSPPSDRRCAAQGWEREMRAQRAQQKNPTACRHAFVFGSALKREGRGTHGVPAAQGSCGTNR